MELLRRFWDAAVALDAAAVSLDEAVRFPGAAPEPLAAAFRAASFETVEVRSIEVPTVFTDFDDLWTPFLSGKGPAPSYVASLGEPGRRALRERVRGSLAQAVVGSIRLVARGWAIRGRRPWARVASGPAG